MNNEILIGIFIIAIGGAIGTYFIQKGRSKLSQESNKEFLLKQDSVKNEVLDSVSASKESIIGTLKSSEKKNLNESKKSTDKILKKQKSSTNKIIDKIEEKSKIQEENQNKILEKINEMPSQAFIELSTEVKKEIIQKLKLIKSNHPQYPYVSIEIESGNSQRNQIALELETILTPLELGGYGKGNTNIGRFPDYPISVFCNSTDIDYTNELMNILSKYFKEGINILPSERFPAGRIRIYLNGMPEFFKDGTVKIN